MQLSVSENWFWLSNVNRVKTAQTNSLTFSKAEGTLNSNWNGFVERESSNF